MQKSLGIQVTFDDDLKDLMYCRKIHPVFIEFEGRRSVKDVIESLGIPHVAVDVIRVNAHPVTFSYIVQDGDRIEVFPDGAEMNVPNACRIRFAMGPEPRYICDDHLWKLSRRLRLLGLDVAYQKRISDRRLVEISREEGRILLTRDRHLLMIRHVERGILIRNSDCNLQVQEVLARMLGVRLDPFSRCLLCNGKLQILDMDGEVFERLEHAIPPKVREWCSEYNVCISCNKVYWKGSHFQKLVNLVKEYYSEDIADI